MRKILAMLFACSMVLAGCIDLSDEDVAEIVDELVDIAACNDAMNKLEKETKAKMGSVMNLPGGMKLPF